jgi:8-oxo-dGTP pyrophosphatase MutT (NUDIX family)
MATMPKTIGVFARLLTKEGKVRLQRRIEKGSIIPGKTFRGDWELPGGRIKEKDLQKALTLAVLKEELIREVKEELGIKIMVFPENPAIYRAIYEDPEKGICDWAFGITIPSGFWEENKKTKREIIDVNPDDLRDLTNRPKGDQGKSFATWLADAVRETK